MKLKEKVAIVTGSARGLGRDYAVRLANEGAKIVLADILDASNVMEEIESKGGEAIALKVDVSNETSVNEMAKMTAERFGRIDVLINNAAIFADLSKHLFFEIPLNEWERMIKINVTGTFLCCKAVFPQMKKQGFGKIINVSSSVFFAGVPNFAHYVTSKGAVIGLTRAMAREAGVYGISVNAIAPGFTISQAIEDNPTFPEISRKIAIESRCFKRNQEPKDLLGVIVFLSSEDSDFITGQTIIVDGGAVLH